MAETNPKEYRLEIDPRILDLLGPSLYTNIYYVLAELIANAYDADATNVYITAHKDDITVEDDGHGMSYAAGDIARYLNVGGATRVSEDESLTRSGKRRRMGRKGVGKLAALSVSENVDIMTKVGDELSGFVLSRHPENGNLLAPIPNEDITFEHVQEHGSAIVMRNPQYRLHKTLDAVRRNLLKIFPLVDSDFRIHVFRENKSIVIESFDDHVMSELATLIALGDDFHGLCDLVPDYYPTRRSELVEPRETVAFPLTMRDTGGQEHEYSLEIRGWIGTYKSTRGRKAEISDFPDNFISLYANKKMGEFNILPAVGQNKLNEVYACPLDVDLPQERQREYRAAIAEAWASTPEAQIDERMPRPSEEALEQAFASLRERRLADPVRHMDAVLRELGEVGGGAQVEDLLVLADRASTPWGRWKPLAAAQAILHRVEPADVLPERAEVAGRLSDELPLLIRDLPPDKAGAWAAAILELYERTQSPYHKLHRQPLANRLWLAWSLSYTDPDRARQLLEPGLDHADPALRLMAGLALARMTGERPPYRLTASPADTAAARQAWLDALAGADLVPPQPFAFIDPLVLPTPVPGEKRSVDLIRLDAQARVVERERNVWAHVLRLLPDGTYLSKLPDLPSAYHGALAGLTAPTGESLVRLEGTFNNIEVAPHGGMFQVQDRGRLIVETDALGRTIWACRSSEQARFAGPAGRGRVLLLRGGKVEVIDRRGETIWAVAVEGDARWATAISEQRAIVCVTQAVQIIDHEAGVIQTLDGFTSVLRLRYHPGRPWMIFDTREIVIYDPHANTRHAYPLR